MISSWNGLSALRTHGVRGEIGVVLETISCGSAVDDMLTVTPVTDVCVTDVDDVVICWVVPVATESHLTPLMMTANSATTVSTQYVDRRSVV